MNSNFRKIKNLKIYSKIHDVMKYKKNSPRKRKKKKMLKINLNDKWKKDIRSG